MATDLTNSDNAGTVVSRINTAIEEQNKGVSQLGADPNASTVISRVNAAISAEDNDQLEAVADSDNAADFIRKTNALFASIRNGGGSGDEPTPDPDYEPTVDDYAYWRGKKYIAFGDSITHTSWTVPLVKRYCYFAAQELGMNPANNGAFTNAGVSGMMMLDNGTFVYDSEHPISTQRVENVHRSFAHELLNPNRDVFVTADEPRGPYGVNFAEYDLITLMLGSNDIQQINAATATYPCTKGSTTDTDSLILNNFYSAYYYAVKRIVEDIQDANADTVLVLCIPPKATGTGFVRVGELKDLIKHIASHYRLPIVNFYDLTGENETLPLLNDNYGVHPTADGHRTMADYLKLRLGQIVHELNLRNT